MKFIIGLFFIVVLLFNSTLAEAQNQLPIDNLQQKIIVNLKEDTVKVNDLLKLSMLYYGTNPTKQLAVAKDVIALSAKIKYDKGTGEGLRQAGMAQYLMGDFKEAEKSFKQGLKTFEAMKYQKGIMACYSLLGNVFTVQNNYPLGLSYFQKALQLALKNKEEQVSGQVYGSIGVIYSQMQDFPKGLEFFKKGLDIHTRINFIPGITSGLNNVGNTYFYNKQYTQALAYYQKALAKNLEISNKTGIARDYGNIAAAQTELKDFTNAFINHNKALKLSEELKNKKGIAISLQGIGNLLVSEGKYLQALNYSLSANGLANTLNVIDIQKESAETLSIIYEKTGKPDSALYYFKKFKEAKELSENENNKKTLLKLQVQYEFDKKEEKYKTDELISAEKLKQQQLILALNQSKLLESNKERDLVSLNYQKTQAELKNEQLEKKAQDKQFALTAKENQINKIIIQASNKQRWYLMGGLGLLLIIGALLLWQNTTRKKLNTQLLVFNDELDQANKVKTRFFSILNHDLRSPVSNLIHFLHLQKEAPEMLSESDWQRLENKTLNSTENLLQSMEDLLLWSKGQMESFKPSIKSVAVRNLFDDTAKHFSGTEQVKLEFENPFEMNLTTDEDYLKTIIRNLTSNAIKALSETKNAQIVWKAWEENNQSYLSVTDNGPGGTAEQFKALYDEKEVVGIKSGLGLHLIRDLANAISCKVSVDTKAGGTTFLLALN